MVAVLILKYDIVKKLAASGIDQNWRKYMRLTTTEKQEIIQLVDRSELGVNKLIPTVPIFSCLGLISFFSPAKTLPYNVCQL